MQNLQWFIDRIGKEVYEDNNKIVLITDENEAERMHRMQYNDFVMYSDELKKPKVQVHVSQNACIACEG